jgi:hypothetical protein
MTMHSIPELDARGLRQFALTTGGIVAGLFGLLLPWLFDANCLTGPGSWPRSSPSGGSPPQVAAGPSIWAGCISGSPSAA